MARSVKKGPFVDGHLAEKIAVSASCSKQKSHQDLVAAEHDYAGRRRTHLCRSQSAEIRPGLRDREHGGPQAGRVRAHPHVSRALGRQEVEGRFGRRWCFRRRRQAGPRRRRREEVTRAGPPPPPSLRGPGWLTSARCGPFSRKWQFLKLTAVFTCTLWACD